VTAHTLSSPFSQARNVICQYVSPSKTLAPRHTRSISRPIPLSQFLYSNLAFLGTVVYSQRFARPKWSLTKLVAISTFLGFGSYTFGFNQKLTAHFRFARSLEDPAGFNRALRSVNARLGGPEHFPYGVPERREDLMSVVLGPRVTASSMDPSVSSLPLETTEPGEDLVASRFQEPEQSHRKSVPIRHDCASSIIPVAGASGYIPSHLDTGF
jgi:hypothetical protein